MPTSKRFEMVITSSKQVEDIWADCTHNRIREYTHKEVYNFLATVKKKYVLCTNEEVIRILRVVKAAPDQHRSRMTHKHNGIIVLSDGDYTQEIELVDEEMLSRLHYGLKKNELQKRHAQNTLRTPFFVPQEKKEPVKFKTGNKPAKKTTDLTAAYLLL